MLMKHWNHFYWYISTTLAEKDTVNLEAQFNKTEDRIQTLENEMEKAEEKIR